MPVALRGAVGAGFVVQACGMYPLFGRVKRSTGERINKRPTFLTANDEKASCLPRPNCAHLLPALSCFEMGNTEAWSKCISARPGHPCWSRVTD